ncbi:MAG: ABC transporter substrate-binding protein, partial [Actinomycetota bacterium]
MGLVLLVLALVASACGGSSDSGESTDAADVETGEDGETTETTEGDDGEGGDAEGSGGTLRIGMTAGNIPFPGTPPNEGFEGRRFVGYQIYDALFRYNVEQGDEVPIPEPGLAESFEVSDDELTWTITLRQDVTFHDGATFDADAVIFNLDRISDESFEYYDADSANSNVSWLAQIESYEKTGDYEVSFTTGTPYAWLPYDLSFVYFASPDAVMANPDDYLDNATGTGPFKMVEYVDGQLMVLEAFDDYYRGRPALDSIELYPMPEPATRLAALQAGDIDWAELPPPDAVAQLEASGFQVFLKEYPHVITYQLNVQKPPFDDVRVRQALNYAVDREGTSALINDVGYPATQYLYEGHPWYDEDWEGYPYDPERAIELLAEAGVEEGLEFNIAY